MNKLLTSNETILNPIGIFVFLILSMKFSVFSTVYSDIVKGRNNLLRYLAVSYVAVPMLETIGRSLSCSTVSLDDSL